MKLCTWRTMALSCSSLSRDLQIEKSLEVLFSTKTRSLRLSAVRGSSDAFFHSVWASAGGSRGGQRVTDREEDGSSYSLASIDD